ncbi:hypothetical protein Pla52n_43060 [Stieleria varia]|uniref:Uncharacterized protein n=1 Tax=Stieleria varia TaxID=2528005 RepID=A0A5C6AP97_9BACT|nr:hypothetical protein Pla52n_43060 [Stieleria varia]
MGRKTPGSAVEPIAYWLVALVRVGDLMSVGRWALLPVCVLNVGQEWPTYDQINKPLARRVSPVIG